jgi:hypothetical protein
MDTVVIVGIAILVGAALICGFVWWQNQSKRSKGLRERFGPEYEHVVGEAEKRRDAERELEQRAARVERLHLKDLEPDARQRYSEQWVSVQARFVDDPNEAIFTAHQLVQQVMAARGYPITDFEQQAADVSVDHPEVVRNYRVAHDIMKKHEDGGATTEDLRQAMVHYRALFNELLGFVTSSR